MGVQSERELSLSEPQIISVRDLIEVLFRNLKIISICTGIFLIVGIIYARYQAPIFQSQALLKISESSGGALLLSKLGGSNASGSSDHVAMQQYILESRGLLEKAITKYHLDIVATPWRFPFIGQRFANLYNKTSISRVPSKPWMGLSRYGWGGDRIVVSEFDLPAFLKGNGFTVINRDNNQYELNYGRKTILSGQVGQLETVIYNGSPISILISELSANPNTHFSLVKLHMLRAIVRFKSMVNIDVPASHLLKLTAIGSSQEHLPTMLAAIIDTAMDVGVQLRAQQAEKILSFVNKKLPAIQKNLDEVNNQVNSTLPMGNAYEHLSDQRNVQTMAYNNMLVDVEQFAMEKASLLSDITVVTPPSRIFQPSSTPNINLEFYFAVVGLVLSTLFVFGRHLLLGVVSDPARVEKITGLNLLAAFQVAKSQSNQMMLYKKGRVSQLKTLSEFDINDVTLEAFRSLRTALFLNYLSDINTQLDKRRIITINSPVPNTGKSFISVNFAEQLAESGCRVLLIDADIRKGSLSNYFEGSLTHPGLIDLLQQNKNQATCILKTRFENLDFLPSGKISAKNAGMLLKKNIDNTLSELLGNYEYIVIDTAPVLAVSDTLIICQHAGTNLMAFGHGKHNEREIDLSLKRFEQSSIKLSGFVMNFIPLPKLGYGNGYGYGYGYGTDARE